MNRPNARKSRNRRSRRRLDSIPSCVRPRSGQPDPRNVAPLPSLPTEPHNVNSGTQHSAFEELKDCGNVSGCDSADLLGYNAGVSEESSAVLAEDIFAGEPRSGSEDIALEADAPIEPPSITNANALMATDKTYSSQSEDASSMRRGLHISNWRVLWAIIMSNGSRRLTKDTYQSVRNFVDAFGGAMVTSWIGKPYSVPQEQLLHESEKKRSVALPHYSTLHKTYKPRLLNHLTVRSKVTKERVDLSKAGARSSSKDGEGEPVVPLLTILPSEYARADVASPVVWSEMCSTSLSAQHRDSSRTSPNLTDCVDTVPIVAGREWFYGPKRAMYIDERAPGISCSAFAEVGDVVDVHVLNDSPLVESVLRCFGTETEIDDNECTLRGVVCHTWHVHHNTRADDESFHENYRYNPAARDHEIASALTFSLYKSPFDSVTVEIPELPAEEEFTVVPDGIDDFSAHRGKKRKPSAEMVAAKRKRRAALREKRRQENVARQGWKKPILKPGDFAVLIRPLSKESTTLLTETDRNSRICVVHRFWAEMEEKSRHLFWIPGGRSVDVTSESQTITNAITEICAPMCKEIRSSFLNVRATILFREHDGERGPQAFTPISSEGVLQNGELYFIYRFVLFWDGFQLQAGKQASGDGVYMLCLNLPQRSRASPNAVRILSLTPPGVSCSAVISRILPDIIEGMTTGFLDYDGDGNCRRIFLDLVGCVGDTPALNYTLDVLGHTAAACCHLCRFTRASSTKVGSRYTAEGPHGSHSSFSRGFFEHAALHDCGANQVACRGLGMKYCPDYTKLPLHSIREAKWQAKSRIPTTSTGALLLPYHWDPYKSCFVAPDHLATGHLRDCITLAYRMLPTKECRRDVEQCMLHFLAECGMKPQNRLFDQDKKTLHTMSMTELYALASVAEIAFMKACELNTPSDRATVQTRPKTTEAISLVGSCARLIAIIWRKADRLRDGYSANQFFQEQQGLAYIYTVQKEVDKHLSKVCDVCTLSDSDSQILEDEDIPASEKSNILRVHRDCLLAIKAIDKPNLHRFRELAYSTLPMVGHMSLIGELVLEKSHQSLKRIVKKSNNKDVHLLSLQSIAIDDWQGRLTSAVSGVFDEDKAAILLCYRLLSGREAVASLRGKLTNVEKNQVIQTLGPENCIRRELETQGMSVISPRNAGSASLSWRLVEQDQINALNSELSTAFRSRISQCSIKTGSLLSSSLPNGLAGPCFRRGDVVETLCCLPKQASLHYPFLLQTNCSAYLGHLSTTSAPSLWLIRDALVIQDNLGGSTHYLAVRPCVEISENRGQYNLQYVLQKFRSEARGPVSFAKVDHSMRKVGVILDWEEHALFHIDEHNGSSLTFYALTRADGYPPRQG